MRSTTRISVLVPGVLWIAMLSAQPVEILPGSVNDVMVNVITPVTNTIWGIEAPQTDDEWQSYVDAANELVAAATRIKDGGAGPSDASWAAEADWQRFADALVESGREMAAAAAKKDLEAYIDISNDQMYPPCEECHIMFHPGFQEQEVN